MTEQTYALAKDGVYGQANGAYQDALSAIPDSGVLRYAFEDDSETTVAADSFTGGTHTAYDGTISGGSFTSTNSLEGSLSLSLDGTDDYVSYPDGARVAAHDSEWSVGVRFRLDSLPSSGNVYTLWRPGHRDYNISVTDTGDVRIFSWDGSANSVLAGVSVSAGSVYHAVGSSDGGGGYTIDVDGTSNSGSLPAPNSTSGVNSFGAQANQARNYTPGDIDVCDLYDKELTATERSNLQSTGSISG